MTKSTKVRKRQKQLKNIDRLVLLELAKRAPVVSEVTVKERRRLRMEIQEQIEALARASHTRRRAARTPG